MTIGSKYILVIAVSLWSVSAVIAAPTQHAFNFTEAYKLAIKLNQDADDRMYENMEALADWFLYNKETYGRFPEIGADEEKADQFCKRFLKNNPYSATGSLTKAEQNRQCKVRFQTDGLLGRRLIEALSTSPPPSWTAEPGTITVVTNTENIILVWAAGADHRPLMDAKTGKARFVVVEVKSKNVSGDLDPENEEQ